MPRSRDRQRASRACDICKKKKIRCTGTQPCELCTRDKRECTYHLPYYRGKKRQGKGSLHRNAPLLPYEGLMVQDGGVDEQLPDLRLLPPTDEPLLSAGNGDATLLSPSETESIDNDGTSGAQTRTWTTVPDVQLQRRLPFTSARTSPEPGESDQAGHFVGAASGLSFPLRLQRRLRKGTGASQATSLFTLGDSALPNFDFESFLWPSLEEAQELLTTYFEIASPTYRFLHRPTVEIWLDQLYHPSGVQAPHSKSKTAVLLAAFAQATGYIKRFYGSMNGLRYFQAAQHYLGEQKESANLPSVQALLGSCFYVLTCSRLNHCWTLFGTTSRLILALGLNRRKTRSFSRSHIPADNIEQECAKRVYWSAFTLDKYLSAIFGRPSVLQDEDTDQDMPTAVEDADLTETAMALASPDSINVMLASICHQKLARISGSTLKKLYGIKPQDRESRYYAMNELAALVEAWRADLPAFLNPKKIDSRALRPLFQRQSNLLSLASWHVEILIHRPCLLEDFSSSTPEEWELIKGNVQRCLNAAMGIVAIIDLMVETGQFFPVSWFAHYQSFSAVIILYTFTIKNKNKEPTTWMKYYHAAQRCQNMIAAVPKADSLGQRLLLIMEEYENEVVRQVMPNDFTPDMPTDMIKAPDTESTYDNDSGRLTELPDWEQLSSLALDTGFVDFEMNLVGTHVA